MKMNLIIICIVAVALLVVSTAAQAQTINHYHFPFHSKDNSIELTVENASDIAATGLSVSFSGSPRWLHFANPAGSIPLLKAKSAQTVKYSIIVDRLAPVGVETVVPVRISTPDGQVWSQSFAITIDAPTEYLLMQNYPNPFNPATTIEYQLPVQSNVTLIVYDVLGQEVAELYSGIQDAGYNSFLWNAASRNGASVPSGLYFYRLKAIGVSDPSHPFVQIKSMILIR